MHTTKISGKQSSSKRVEEGFQLALEFYFGDSYTTIQQVLKDCFY